MPGIRSASALFLGLAFLLAIGLITGCSDSDESPAGVPVDTRPPAIPSGVSGWSTVGAVDQVHLQWEANVSDADLAGYMVYRSDRIDGGFRPLSERLITSNSWTDASVRPGMTYYYRVSARDASDNESGPSQIFAVTTAVDGEGSPDILDPMSP